MKNSDIAKVLNSIALYLDMQGVPFKPRAYERAAGVVENLPEELSDIYARGGKRALDELPSVGEAISKKIEEMLLTGKLAYLEKLKAELPVDAEGLRQVPGLGPKKIAALYRELGVKNLEDLEKAAKDHKISRMASFGSKSEEAILHGIEIAKGGKGRFLRPEIEEMAESVLSSLQTLEF